MNKIRDEYDKSTSIKRGYKAIEHISILRMVKKTKVKKPVKAARKK